MKYYLLLNGIEIEDLGLEEKDFTIEKKLKFIQNCSRQFSDGKELVNQIFLTLSVRLIVTILIILMDRTMLQTLELIHTLSL